MQLKKLKFSVNQIVINDQSTCDIGTFEQIISGDIDTGTIINRDTREIEITSIKKIEKSIEANRYVLLYFNYGGKFPYTAKVMKPDLSEQDNPRPPNDIELKDQFFALIDTEAGRIYLSDQRMKSFVISYLSTKLAKNVIIKSIIKEEDFMEKISAINSIVFSAAPNLLSSIPGSGISEALVSDIYGYDAEKATLRFDYHQKTITPNIMEKIRSLISNKLNFEEIVIIGRDDHDLESIFNLDEVVSKVSVEAQIDPKSNFFEATDVFNALIATFG